MCNWLVGIALRSFSGIWYTFTINTTMLMCFDYSFITLPINSIKRNWKIKSTWKLIWITTATDDWSINKINCICRCTLKQFFCLMSRMYNIREKNENNNPSAIPTNNSHSNQYFRLCNFRCNTREIYFSEFHKMAEIINWKFMSAGKQNRLCKQPREREREQKIYFISWLE